MFWKVRYDNIGMRGYVTVHDEFVVHGSGGNMSSDRRRTYVLT